MKSKYKKWHKYIKSTVKYFVKNFPKGTVLDVGARDGYALRLFRKAGFYAMGIDIYPEAPEVREDDFTQTTLDTNFKYDYIYSRHVLEHCSDAHSFFESCNKVLKPKGLLFMTVPLESDEKFEKRNEGKPKEEWNHKINFPEISVLADFVSQHMKLQQIGYSKDIGILPLKTEVCLIASKT